MKDSPDEMAAGSLSANFAASKEQWKKKNQARTEPVLTEAWLKGVLHRLGVEPMRRTGSDYDMMLGVGLSIAASLAIFIAAGTYEIASYAQLGTASLLNRDDAVLFLDKL